MKRWALVAAAVAVALALVAAGCSRSATPEPAAVARPKGRPLAAIVEFDSYAGRGSRVLRRIPLQGSVTTLPVELNGDSDVALSSDGNSLLYTPVPSTATSEELDQPGYSLSDEVRSLDVSSGVSRAVFRGPSVTYGYDSRGRIVVLVGRGPQDAMRFLPQGDRSLHVAEVLTISDGQVTSLPVDASTFTDITDVRFLTADDGAIYLAGTNTPGLHSVEQSIWTLDRATGKATPLARYPDSDHWSPPGERRPWLSDWVRLPSEQILRDGLPMLSTATTGYVDPKGAIDNRTGKPEPVEISYGVATAIELYRLPEMTVARSIVVTQPAGMQAFVTALSPDLGRCLVRLTGVTHNTEPLQPIFERGPAGAGAIAVPQNLKSRPQAIGYIGEDVLYSFYRAPSYHFAVWFRDARTTREIGSLAADAFSSDPLLLGVEYAR